MRTYTVLGCVGVLVASVVAACAGDEAKQVRAGAGGGAGRGEGGAAGFGQGAGQNEPTPGGAGAGASAAQSGAGAGGATAGGAGGVPQMDPNGGSGALSPSEGGGGGNGGAPSVECPVGEPGTFTHQCADSVTTWSPIWNGTLERFELQLGALPFPLASGTISFFYSFADGQQCGTVPIEIGETSITAPVVTQFNPTAVRITTFTFVDVCGNTHQYDAAGAPACNDIRGSGTGFGNLTLACFTRLDGNCPEACD